MMRRAFLVLLVTSVCNGSVEGSTYAQNKDLTVEELADILGVTTWRVQITTPPGHDLVARFLLLPEGSVYEQSKVHLYAPKTWSIGRRQVLFVVRERDDGHIQIALKTPQGSSSREFLPPRSWAGSTSYGVEGIERLADKFVLMQFTKQGSPVAAIAYWFERPESSGR